MVSGRVKIWALAAWLRRIVAGIGAQQILKPLFMLHNTLILNALAFLVTPMVTLSHPRRLRFDQGGRGSERERGLSYTIHHCPENLWPLPRLAPVP